MDVTSCVVTKFVKEDGKPVIRPYTPTSDADHTGSFDFVIKRYEGNVLQQDQNATFHLLRYDFVF
jgi:cytochrome-b5 reductase